ncbi:toxin-antitoxin system YwqK family antitoxin [Aurantibacillus circumpalustris]|uniref:toxin-antitoxin system YwqK family antitoxin n=1 Tax=Aurantibacillus circumpalustris TaxID=3036359 RepID=UPI00295A7A45|nr:hypothetical protein [Aurantibacillus circumpalustris]
MRKVLVIIAITSSFLGYSQTTDSKGQKQGYWKKTDEKNKLIYEGAFKDNKPVGKFKYYYQTDSIRAIMYFNANGKGAYAKLFHMNGKRMAEGKYINEEIKDSTWTYYDELGILISRENYKNGKKDGVFTVYLPDGSVSEERNYKNDLQSGPFKQYFSGNTVKAQGNYINDKLEGRVTYHYPNGVEVAAGYYKNGSKNGPWIYKTESGKVREKELYKNGILASQKETDEFFAKSKTQDSNPAKSNQQKKK